MAEDIEKKAGNESGHSVRLRDGLVLFRRSLVRVVWPRIATFAKGITWVTTLAAGITAIILWVPMVHSQVMWRDVEYGLLDKLSAGSNSAYVDSLLGLPAVVKRPENAPELIEKIYLRRDYYVSTVVDEAQRVLLYSVLSCSPDFTPTFRTPSGSTVQLQGVPLDEAESHEGLTAPYDPNDRFLTYSPQLSVSSLGQLIETARASGSNAVKTQYWFVGVNSACADLSGFGDVPFESTDSASIDAAVVKNRSQVAANFYAVTAIGVDVRLDAEGDVFLDDYAVDVEYSGIRVSPFHFDLPPRGPDARTRTFAPRRRGRPRRTGQRDQRRLTPFW